MREARDTRNRFPATNTHSQVKISLTRCKYPVYTCLHVSPSACLPVLHARLSLGGCE